MTEKLILILRRKILTAANTTHNDRKNIDYSVASTNQKKEIINTTHPDHRNRKRDPRSSSSTNNTDLHSSAPQTIIATTIDITRHHYSPTTTKNNMRHNNISQTTDTLKMNKNSAVQNVVPTRTRHSIFPVQSPS